VDTWKSAYTQSRRDKVVPRNTEPKTSNLGLSKETQVFINVVHTQQRNLQSGRGLDIAGLGQGFMFVVARGCNFFCTCCHSKSKESTRAVIFCLFGLTKQYEGSEA